MQEQIFLWEIQLLELLVWLRVHLVEHDRSIVVRNGNSLTGSGTGLERRDRAFVVLDHLLGLAGIPDVELEYLTDVVACVKQVFVLVVEVDDIDIGLAELDYVPAVVVTWVDDLNTAASRGRSEHVRGK